MHYFGFKLQFVLSKSGAPLFFGLAPANVHDVRYLEYVSDTPFFTSFKALLLIRSALIKAW
jgi:hypothetical protein